MSELPATYSPNGSAIEKAVIQGDLSQLSEEECVAYYLRVCDSLGLNPWTKPFGLFVFDGKKQLYAKKDCAEQLRKIHGVSIVSLEREKSDGVYMVVAHARTSDGRTDEAIGMVSLEKEGGDWKDSANGKRYFKGNGVFLVLRGDDYCNAVMKCETKAKRRVTFSICGLGISDETEVSTIEGAEILPDLDLQNRKAVAPGTPVANPPEQSPQGSASFKEQLSSDPYDVKNDPQKSESQRPAPIGKTRKYPAGWLDMPARNERKNAFAVRVVAEDWARKQAGAMLLEYFDTTDPSLLEESEYEVAIATLKDATARGRFQELYPVEEEVV